MQPLRNVICQCRITCRRGGTTWLTFGLFLIDSYTLGNMLVSHCHLNISVPIYTKPPLWSSGPHTDSTHSKHTTKTLLCRPVLFPCSPKGIADLFYSYFTTYLQAINSPAQIHLVCYFFDFHFLPNKKSHRGHFFWEVLNASQWTALHGLMPHRVILLGADFKIRISSSCSCYCF